MSSRNSAALAISSALLLPASALAQVTLHFNERPPYLVMKDGNLTGLTGSPAIAAFKAAGVPFTVAATPASRQLDVIKAGTGNDCGIGWFKNPEREGFAKFTKPIYQDEPQLALTAASNPKLKDGDTVEHVLGDKNLTLLAKQSYSYGKALDALIESLKPNRQVVVQENVAMVKMIQAGRADYMFTAPEEADGVVAAAGLKPEDIRKIRFANAPKGEQRFIMCSKAVPDDVVSKVNAAIK